MAKKKMTYEDAIKRMEEIAEALEAGDVSLDDSINLYKEGMELSKFCKEKLDIYEKEIMMLKRDENGKIEEMLFDGEEE